MSIMFLNLTKVMHSLTTRHQLGEPHPLTHAFSFIILYSSEARITTIIIRSTTIKKLLSSIESNIIINEHIQSISHIKIYSIVMLISDMGINHLIKMISLPELLTVLCCLSLCVSSVSEFRAMTVIINSLFLLKNTG